MATKMQLTKLSNQNYFTWKFKIQLLLIKEKVWDTINKPTPETPNSKWIQDDETARAIIGLNIEDGQIPHIRNASSAK